MRRFDILTWYRDESLGARLFVFLRSFVIPIHDILEQIPRVGSILDIACGHGLFLHCLVRSRLAGQKVVLDGIDIDEKRLNVARRTLKNYPNVHLFHQDVLNWDPPQQYNCILLVDILHHLNSQARSQILRKAKDWLGPDGYLVVKDLDCYPRWKYIFNNIHDRVLSGIEASAEPMDAIRTALVSYSFDILINRRIDRWRPYAHYLLVGRKQETESNLR